MLSSRRLTLACLVILSAACARSQTAIWANTGSDFSTPANWGNATLPGTTDTAVFSAASVSAQPTLSSAASVQGLQFSVGAGNFTLSGTAALTVGSSGIDNQTTTGVQSITAPLAFSTATSINNQGALTINGAVTNNSGLTLSGAGMGGLISGAIAGTGPVTVSGTGSWKLSAANSYTGDTNLSSGSLTLGNSLALQNSTLNYTGGVLDFGSLTSVTLGALTGTGSVFLTNSSSQPIGLVIGNDNNGGSSFAGAISGAGSLTKVGNVILTLSGANSYTGGTTINADNLVITGSGSLPTGGNVTIAAIGTSYAELDLNPNVNQTVHDLNLGGAGAQTNGSNSVHIDPTATLTVSGNVNYSATNNPSGATISGGTLALGANAANFNVDHSTNATLGDLAITSVITGNAGFTKTGVGTLVIVGNATNTGLATISAGTLQLGDGSNTGMLAGDIANGGALVFKPGTSTMPNYAGAISGTGTVEFDGSVLFTGTNTYTGVTTINSGATLQLGLGAAGVGGTSGSIGAGGVVDSGALVAYRSDALSLANVTGNGTVQQLGAGTLTLTGTNTYTGGTMIGAGTVTGALPVGGSVFMHGGNLTIAGAQSLNTLGDWNPDSAGIVPGNVSIGSASSLTILSGASFSGSTFSGPISGAGALVIGSSGNQAIGGNVTVASVSISPGGILRIGDGTTNGSVASTITNSGTIEFNRSDAISYGGFSGTGSIRQMGSGTLTLTGTNTFSGTTELESGTLADGGAAAFSPQSAIRLNASGTNLNVNFNETIAGLGGGSGSVGSNVTLASGATLTINTTGRSYAGTIGGAGALTLTGSGSQILSGNSSYTGPTQINSGRLIVDNLTGSATGNGTITIANGATLQLGNFSSGGAVAGNITNNGSIEFASTDTTAHYDGMISGSGNLNVGVGSSTGGTLSLNGVNSYTGGTYVNSGTLRIGTANALPSGTNLGLNSGSTLDVSANQTLLRAGNSGGATIQIASGATLTLAPAANSYGGTIDATVTGGGALALNGGTGSSATLTHANSYSGGTTVTGGTLYVGNNTALGAGSLTLQTGSGLAVGKGTAGDITLGNNASLASGVTLGSDKHDAGLVLAGTVTTSGGAATLHIGEQVQFNGTLKAASGTTALTLDSATNTFGHAVFNNTSLDSSITSVTLNTAGIVFGAASAVPASSPNLIKGSNGYVGIAGISGAVPTASSVLSLIDPAHFTGVFGFDSADSHSAMTVFSSPVDVSMFGTSLTLGSASSAVLGGTITPSATGGYLFGNGGGALVVSSNLTGANNVTVSSATGIPGNHLIAILRGANSFTGAVSVANSELILDSATALPAGRAVSLGADGYLGYTEAFTGVSSFNDFVTTRVAPGAYTSSSVLGIDSNVFISSQISSGTSAGNRLLSDVIDLRLLGPIGLGTTTRATLSGQIFAPMQSGANGALTLIARNDGQLAVNSDLVAGQVNSVSVGSPTGNANGSVILNGRNTYAGGTTLNNGNIILGQSSEITAANIGFGALGSGTVTVATSANKPILAAGSSHIFVQNPIALGTSLQLGVSSSSIGDGIPSGISSNFLGLHGIISDLAGAVGSLDTYGYVSLAAANTFTGGVNVHEGYLTLGNDSALGTGTWTLSPGTTSSANYIKISSSTPRTIANNVVYAGAPRGVVSFGGSFTLNGAVTLDNDVMFAPYTYPLTFNGPISGPGRLMNYGSGTIALNGSNTYTGGTESQWGAIVFNSATAMPAAPFYNALVATGTGYVGIGFIPGSLQHDFIDRFDKGMTSGTIGLDGGNTFTGSIDLTSFYSSPRLGSASSATFSGTITPQGNAYNFGGGGGKLEVSTTLTDGSLAAARSVNVLSPGSSSAALTLRLTGANTFSGGVTVTNSGVVFGPGALPATGTLTPGYAAYIGTEDAAFAANPTSFVNRFNVGATNAIVGFDGLTVTGNISLAQFVSTSDPGIVLGTTSTATISGGITLPTAQAAYRFSGYKGGSLTVQSLLADGSSARAVIIGDSTNAATFSAPASPGSALSSVTLAGANTYTGGTTLNAGELYVANDGALGTGTLTVAANSSNDGRSAALYAAGGARNLSNAIALGSDDLDIGGVNNLTLAGSISGSGELRKVGSGTLTLSGTNSFSGDMYLQGGNVVFTTGASVGTGSLEFGLIGSSATFLDNSTVNGIYADLNIDTINLTAGKTLTVNQTFDSQFEGTFAGSTAGLILTGSGYHLHLDGASTFNGPTTIQGGLVAVAGNANAFGASTNAVTVNGGKLATAAGVVVANPVTLTSGAIGGVGTLKAAAGSLGFNIGSGLTLAPGLGGPGTMRFDGSLISTSVLILSNGGTYRWQLLDAASGSGFDTIAVNGTVNVAATSAAPFNFSINSIVADGTNGLAANFDPAQSYSWTVLSATSITGFTGSNQFAIDTSGFWNPNSGAFSLSVNSSNTALMLNFSPIPEPSTYALMIAGLGTLLFVSRRRRR